MLEYQRTYSVLPLDQQRELIELPELVSSPLTAVAGLEFGTTTESNRSQSEPTSPLKPEPGKEAGSGLYLPLASSLIPPIR